jgi:hypothetical protein
MLKYNSRCNVCLAVKDNTRLLNEIFNSSFYLGRGAGPSLQSIAKKYEKLFKYVNLTNHCKKHQFISDKDFTNRSLNKIAKDAEHSIIKRSIESKQVFDEVIGRGMEDLQSGKLTVDTKDLLNAAKLKKDFQLKEQDQQLAMMEMVMHFASGENNESKAYDRRVVSGQTVADYDPADGVTADFERRKAQSSAFYQSLAGDASPPRAD